MVLVVIDGHADIARLAGLRAARPAARLLVVTEECDAERLRGLLDAGAAGCVLFQVDPAEMATAIRTVAAGQAFLDVQMIRGLAAARPPAAEAAGAIDLSGRHVEILELLGAGLPNKVIAQRLDITEKTVKTHLTEIFRRLGVRDRVHAALWAKEHLPGGRDGRPSPASGAPGPRRPEGEEG